MQPHSSADLRSLFDQALDLAPAERARFLRDVQMRLPLVYPELHRLLAAHEGPAEVFEQDGGIWSQVKLLDLVGRRLGAYEITLEIGRGGMGAVYEARRADEAYSKTVAIKVISGAVMTDGLFDAFRRERQILAQLEHPNIARLLDGGATEDGLLYLVMEYINGQPLDFYALSRNLSLPEVLRLFLAVCSAVSFAHRNLIVHRDLKPSNILVTSEGDVKLLDFGIAKVLDPNRRETKTVALRLTPEFASPEQIRGEAISTASDVYSIGVLLFHVLTGGKRPYRTTSQAVPDILQSVLTDEALRASAVAPPEKVRKLRGDLDTIIAKAMAKDPARRYVSVDQLREDLERHLTGRPILARSDSFLYRAAKFTNRHRVPVGFGALVLVSVLVGLTGTLFQAREAQRQREEAVAARQVAEAQKHAAEEQERIALKAQAFAEEQRRVAESRTQEAMEERARAEARYQSVRSLATAVLFDVNNSLRQVPGTEGARQSAALAALKQLEALAQKSTADAALMADIASAYEQVAENMTGAFGDSPEGASLAIPALQKAIQLRAQLKDAVRLAETQRLLGNSFLLAKQPATALSVYRESLRTLERGPGGGAAQRVAAMSHINLCTAEHMADREREAVEHCQKAVKLLDGLSGASFADLGVLKVLAHGRLGGSLRGLQQDAAAEVEFRQALRSIDALDTQYRRVLEELIAITAKLSVQQQALRMMGVMKTQTGKRDEALETFEEAMKLSGGQPAMKDVVAYAEAAVMVAEAERAKMRGQVQPGLELLRRAVTRLGPNPSGAAGLLRTELEQQLRLIESAPAAQQP